MLDTIKSIAEIVGILAAALGLPGVILWYLAGRKTREEGQQKSTRLVLKGIRKIGQLSYAAALCAAGQKPNGELSEAMDGYGDYMEELNDHIENKASK